MADPLSIASSIAGLISIGDVVFRKLYHYAKSVAGAESEVLGLKNEVATLTGVLHNLRLVAQELEDDGTIHNSVRIDHVNSCLATLYKINGLLSKIDFPKGKLMTNAMQKLKWPIRSSETKSLSAEVKRHCDVLSLALSADSMTVLLQTLSSQKDIVSRLDKIDKTLQSRERAELRIALDNDRKRILRAFFAVEPRHYLETILDLRHPTTGFWLVQSDIFQAWLREPGSRLWLSGIPGAGKTIFSGLIVQECFAKMNKTTAVAYFHCDYKNQLSLNIVNLLSALAGQIAMKNENSFLLLQNYYEDLHPPDQMGRQPKAEELVELIHEMAFELDDVRIVIDGLDECGDHTRQAAEWLYKLVSCTSANISFVLLSRDEPDIRDTLDDLAWSHIEITAHTEDIEHYVRSEIEQRIRNKRLRTRSDELKNLIVEQLISRAQGMFRWVSCQLDHLCELPTDSQRRQALEKLPETLNETYERILLRIKRPAVPLVIKTLQWLVYGKPKLSTEALLDALSIDDESDILDLEARPTEDDVLSCCSSLIRRTDTYLELAHFTVQEFLQTLTTTNNGDLGQFQITSTTKSLLATRCLSYLCAPVFDQPPPPNIATFITFRELYPFHGHAATAWITYMADHWNQPTSIQLYGNLFDPKKTLNFILYISDRMMEKSISSEYDDIETLYLDSSKLIQDTRFRPLHAAAMLGLEPVTQWLVRQACDVGMICPWGSPLEMCYTSILAKRPEFGLDLDYLDLDAAVKTAIYLINSGTECSSEDQGSKMANTRVESLLSEIKSSRDDPSFLSIIGLLEKASLVSTLPTEPVPSDDGFRENLKRSVELDQIQHVEKLVSDPRFSFQPMYHGRTIIDIAASSGAVQVLQLLFDRYDDTVKLLVNEPLKTGSPLLHSLTSGTEASSIFLLDIIDPQHEMLHDPAIVHLCVARGFGKLLQKILLRGVNISAVIDHNRSAWFYVTPWTTEETYDLLVTGETDPLSPDRSGIIPLQALLDGNRDELFSKYDVPDWRLREGVFTEKMVDHLVTPSSVHCRDPEGRSMWFHFCARYIPRFIRSKISLTSSQLELLGQRLVQCRALEAHESVSASKNGLDLLVENVITVHHREVLIKAHHKQIGSLFVAIFTSEHLKFTGGEDYMRSLLIWAIAHDDRKLFDVLLQRDIDFLVGSSLDFGQSVIGFSASEFQTPEIFKELITHTDPKRLNDRDGTGRAPVHYVCLVARSKKATRAVCAQRLRLLLSVGADPNLEDETGKTPLHLAATTDFLEGIQLLLDHEADIYRRDTDDLNICNFAAVSGSVRTLEFLHQQFPDDIIWQNKCNVMVPSGHRFGGCSSFHLAVLYGHIKVLDFLKASDRIKDIDERLQIGHSPLHLAVIGRKEGVVDWLINEGVDLDATTRHFKETALHFAMVSGNFSDVRSLVKAGASFLEDYIGQSPEELVPPDLLVDLMRALDGLSLPGFTLHDPSSSSIEQALFVAIRSGNVDLCRSLCDQNPEAHLAVSPDCGSCTPLIAAMCPAQDDCFTFLLSIGATTAGVICDKHSSISKWVEHGFSPVHIAVTDPVLNPKLATLLDLSYQYQDHWSLQIVTPIHVASAMNPGALPILYEHVKRNAGRIPDFDFHSVMEWFDRPGGVPSWCPLNRSAPLHIAAHNANVDSVRYLLDIGADINSPDESGDTALHHAIRERSSLIAEMLLSRGADPNAQNRSLRTPFHLCALYQSMELAELLMCYGADKDAIDGKGSTAVYLAAASSSEAMFVALVEAGCDPTIMNAEGESALTAALARNALRPYVLNRGFDREHLAPPLPSSGVYRDSSISAEISWPLHTRQIFRSIPDSHRMALVNSDAPWCHILVHAAVGGKLRHVRDLIRFGADINYPARYHGSALVAACRFNQLDMVKYLISVGAKLTSTVNGQPITAIHAARKFPKIVHWLLVGRHHEQLRISSSMSNPEHVSVRRWSGVRELAIPLEGCFVRIPTQSLLEYVIWIYLQRRSWTRLVPLDWKPVLYR